MKVSVVTVTYNSAANLAKTLEALRKQDYGDIESIIVDGGSTDHTIEVIQQFEKEFKGTVKWISEKDSGLYDAANKGIAMAEGDIIGCYWDVFSTEDVITKLVNKIEKEGADGVHGDLIYVDGEKIIRKWKMGQGNIKNGWMPGHPTLYLKRAVYEKYGMYNANYRCSGDYEFMIRILKDGEVKLAYIPEVLIKMFYGGVSTSGWKAYRQSIREGVSALKENKVKSPWIVTLKRIGRTMVQFI